MGWNGTLKGKIVMKTSQTPEKLAFFTSELLYSQDCLLQKGEAVDWLLLDSLQSLNSKPDENNVSILISYQKSRGIRTRLGLKAIQKLS